MNKALLLGAWKYMLPVPRRIWQGQVTRDAHFAMEHGLDFMSDDHQRVRDFVVTEIPRAARPLSPAYISERLGLTSDSVIHILDDLEKHMTFLYRNPHGEVAWAYPVTAEHTPHRVSFSTGEQIYAA